MSEEPTKTCVVCGTVFDRSVDGGNRKKFDERKSCSGKCADTLRSTRTEKESKNCTECGESFSRNNRTSKKDFERRRFCSTKCSYASRKGTKGQWRRDGEGQITVIRSAKPRAIEGAPIFPEGHPKEVWRPESWGGSKPLPDTDSA